MSAPSKPDDVEQLIQDFQKSGMRELHVRTQDFELYLSNDATAQGMTATQKGAAPVAGAPSAAASAAVQTATPVKAVDVALPPGGVLVRAPYLGTFYRAPKPGAPVYVNAGDTVEIGAEMCLVEVMKLFTAVRAELRGVVHSVLAQDGQMVEADQPLFVIVPV